MSMPETSYAWLRQQPLFAALDDRALATLIQHLETVRFDIGATILEEGQPGDSAYLVYAGKVRVIKTGPTGQPVTLATLGVGELFGEHALLTDAPRSASVRACEETVLLRMPRAAVQALTENAPEVRLHLERLLKHRGFARVLQLATFHGAVPPRQIATLLDRFEDCVFTEGDMVFREGDPGDRLYLIKSGEAKVVKAVAAGETVLAYLGAGDYFGERALLVDEPRYASVIALGRLECASMSRACLAGLATDAPQVYRQLIERLKQYEVAEEMARKFGVARPSPPAPTIVFEKLEQPPAADVSALSRSAAKKKWLRRYPFIAQEAESDCGAACLAMMARFHGLRVSVERLRYLAHVGADGASMAGLTAAAEQLGFEWRAVRTDFDHLAGLSLPAIAHWQGYHYVVLYDVNGDRVQVSDPARGRLQLSRSDFEAGWTGDLLLLTTTPRLQSVRPAQTVREFVYPLLHARRKMLTGLVLASVVAALLIVALLSMARHLVDQVATGAPFDSMADWLGATIVVGLTLLAVSVVRHRWLARFAQSLSAELETRARARILHLGLGYFQARSIGEHVLQTDTYQLSPRILAEISGTLLDLVLAVFAFTILALSHGVVPAFGLLAVCTVVVLRDRSVPRPGSPDDQSSRAVAVNTLQSMRTIKESVSEASISNRPAPLPAFESTGRVPLDILAGLITLPWVLWLLFALASWILGLLPYDRTIGGLLELAGLSALTVMPFFVLRGLRPALIGACRALQRLADMHDVPVEQPMPACPLPRGTGRLHLEDVCFRPHPESPALLSHITFDAAPGSIVWIVGRAGAGKTTLAHLLQGLHQPTQGKVLLDGCDLATANLAEWRSAVALVSADTEILPGTIRHNIAPALAPSSMEAVIEAAKLAEAHDFILRFPRGYETAVGPGGVELSSGERQALGLARALFKNPRVLILDDAIARLDWQSEKHIRNTLGRLALTRTIFFLTQRPIGVKETDQVLILEAGRIVEAGSHRDLLRSNGPYAFLASVV